MTVAERQRLAPPQLSTYSACAPLLLEVMLRTRASGLSVEAYFQQFGSRDPRVPNALTELTPD